MHIIATISLTHRCSISPRRWRRALSAALLFDDVCRKDLYTALCPKADDIWLWGMELLAGREILFLNAPERTLPTMVSQKIALVKDNIYHKFNDKQIKSSSSITQRSMKFSKQNRQKLRAILDNLNQL